MVCADDPSHYQVCAKWRSENRTMRASKSNSSLTGGGDDVLASKGGKGVFNVLPKKFRNLLRLSKGNGLAASVGDGLNGNAIGTTDRSVVYQFRCEFVETNMGVGWKEEWRCRTLKLTICYSLQDFDMTILSYRNNDFRIMELVEHYARREMMTYGRMMR